MTAIFSFDETDDHIPRKRRDTASSINSFDDRWRENSELEEFDVTPRVRHFGMPVVEESPLRVGTPPIPIPNGSRPGCSRPGVGTPECSLKVDIDEEFVASQVKTEGLLNRKMIPSDFEQLRVLGKGGYGILLTWLI
jgi:hypothetical protein